ncbi:alpha/beta hydrolase [Rhodococcus sp. OK302]|uniref:alpha/beta hydrolase n=1 Tax=Rhodococcus sp. OK302 TaxID=1882769 RepID=UPI000B942C3C|nr:alpha/beta hydrolase [Rhodococcus sp. OK302]OYD66611.1 acetyl esterase [Rhodococcus sp. OK302]
MTESTRSVSRLSARDQAQALLVATAFALPTMVRRRITGPPVHKDGLTLHPDAQMLLTLSKARPRPPLSSEAQVLAAARSELARTAKMMAGKPIPIHTEDIIVRGSDGPLRARLYIPTHESGALLVFFHGGGWVQGGIESHDAPCRLLTETSGARVVSVEYRLSPEFPFPTPVDDAYAAYRDVVARATELGADPARIAVGGDSAGGHLATVVALRARDDGHQVPAAQLLIYPATDFHEKAPSRATFAEGFFLTTANVNFYARSFLGVNADPLNPWVSPLRAPNLSGLPPAIVVTAGFDPLRDEGESYAQKLQDNGVRVVSRRYPGFIHGFVNIVGPSAAARTAVVEIGGMLRALLNESAAETSFRP